MPLPVDPDEVILGIQPEPRTGEQAPPQLQGLEVGLVLDGHLLHRLHTQASAVYAQSPRYIAVAGRASCADHNVRLAGRVTLPLISHQIQASVTHDVVHHDGILTISKHADARAPCLQIMVEGIAHDERAAPTR